MCKCKIRKGKRPLSLPVVGFECQCCKIVGNKPDLQLRGKCVRKGAGDFDASYEE